MLEKKDRFVVFLEDDITTLWYFLHTNVAKELLESKQAVLFYLEDSKEGGTLLQTIAWAIIGK